MKNINKIIFSLIMLTSGQITAAQLNPELSPEEQEAADLAEAIRRSENPWDIDPDMAAAMAASLAEPNAQLVGGGQAAQQEPVISEAERLRLQEEADLAEAMRRSENPQDIDPDMAAAIAASLAPQQQIPDAAGDITEAELSQIEAQIEGAQELENRLENLAEQGNYFLEISENPEIIEVDGQRYTLRQLFTLRQSKVTGNFQRGEPDDTCFAQATKNCAAIIARNDSMNDEELAPLVLMNSAMESLNRINRRLASTQPPEGTEISRDEFGHFHNVDIEFAARMLTESQLSENLLNNLIILNQKGLENLMGPRDEVGLVADMQMLENGGAEFFKNYQISNHALYLIDAWKKRQIMSIGIILQIEGHYIAIVFNQNNPHNIEVLVADSTFGINRVNDPWMTANVYVPLINLLQSFDISNWLRVLREGQQRPGDLMRDQNEDEDQGGGFSLFD